MFLCSLAIVHLVNFLDFSNVPCRQASVPPHMPLLFPVAAMSLPNIDLPGGYTRLPSKKPSLCLTGESPSAFPHHTVCRLVLIIPHYLFC